MTLPLREYQAEDLAKVEEAWREGVQAPAMVWATGLGKTVAFSHLGVRHRLNAVTRRRVLVLAHRTELVAQAARKLRALADPAGLKVGIVMGELNQTLADLVVASPQTLNSPNRRRQLLDVGLVVADECHHYAAPSFLAVLRHFLDQDVAVRALGVTATMSRGDSRSLGRVWQRVVAVRDIAFGIQHGFLVRPVGKRVRVEDYDPSTIARKGGDYEAVSSGAALTASMAPKRIVEAVIEHAPTDKTVVFAPDLASADVIRDTFQAEGLTAAEINYKTPAALRRGRLEAHEEDGPLQVLVNAMVLTEGWDNPVCSTAVIARKTTNDGLYKQMVGRVLRPYFGKTRALVLDVCGVTEHFGLQTQIELFGDDEQSEIEREPCFCTGTGAADETWCSCPRSGCREDCACGGPFIGRGRFKRRCGCAWNPLTELAPPEQLYADGNVVVEDVDLFHGSRAAWMTTHGGTHFLAAGERYIAIVPGEALHTWDVVAMHARKRGGEESRYVQRGVTDLGFAQAWAEADVRPGELALVQKSKGWRAEPATDAQWRRAEGVGLKRAPDVLKGELWAMITRAEATLRMDYTVAYLKQAQHA